LIGAKVGKGVTVKTRQTVTGAKPKKTPGVANNLIDFVIGQTVSGGVDLNRESLTLSKRGED
jgi:hypothetical protein